MTIMNLVLSTIYLYTFILQIITRLIFMFNKLRIVVKRPMKHVFNAQRYYDLIINLYF